MAEQDAVYLAGNRIRQDGTSGVLAKTKDAKRKDFLSNDFLEKSLADAKTSDQSQFRSFDEQYCCSLRWKYRILQNIFSSAAQVPFLLLWSESITSISFFPLCGSVYELNVMLYQAFLIIQPCNATLRPSEAPSKLVFFFCVNPVKSDPNVPISSSAESLHFSPKKPAATAAAGL